MATAQKNMSDYDAGTFNLAAYRFGFVVSEYNAQITELLYEAASDTLVRHGILQKNVSRRNVPGTYELALGAQYLATRNDIDAVICLGCVIQGETRHFEFICQAVAQGIMQVSLRNRKPVSFGVLTTDTLLQAQDRAGGKYGNKGIEAAVAAIRMLPDYR